MLVWGSESSVSASWMVGQYPEGGYLMLRRSVRVLCCAAALSCGLISAPVAFGADPAQDFECGYRSPEATAAAIRDAVERGEIPDPATRRLPVVRSRRTPPHPSAAGVPTLTNDDVFIFEDNADLLATGFSDAQLFNLMAQAANALMVAHGDEFDFVGFFLNFAPVRQIGSAFYQGLENDVSGIGSGIFNTGRAGAGVAGENIEGWVVMWNAANWDEGAAGAFTQLVLGQEFEHRFAMFINPLLDGRSMQGTGGGCGRGSHWNFRVDGQGSGMEIAEWAGSSPATLQGTLRFNTDIGMASSVTGAVFSYPDLYLMGYVSPEEMDAGASELRYLDDSAACQSPYSGPISTWSSADIIASNGPRFPDSTVAQKHFHTGWIMLHRPGAAPTSGDLGHVVNILNQWSETWEWSTLGRGTMDNSLRRADCDSNSIPNDCELDCGAPGGACDMPGCGLATDCNNNAVPDNCEIDETSAAPGGPYFCRSGSRLPCDADCNNNGVIDVCDPDCNANNIPDGCDFDCNANGITDACENIADCNENGFADECDVAGFPFSASSARLSPFGSTSPRSLVVISPPRAGDDLTVTIEASADLAQSTEFVVVAVNGIEIGTVFGEDGQVCPVQPDKAQLTMSAAAYNASLVFGTVAVSVTASPPVSTGICAETFVKVTLEYEARYEDLNNSGVPDECEECTGDGDCDPADLCSANHCVDGLCIPTALVYGDLAGSLGVCGPDGVVDLLDILAVLNGFQGEFADGCSIANIDIAPNCTGDGKVDITDILAVLDAFSGIDPCCNSRR